MKIAAISVLSIFAVLAIVGMILTSRIFSCLEKHHFSAWQKLGSPSLFLNNSASNSWGFMKFVLSEEYCSIADPKLRQLCGALRLSYLASLPLALFFLILLPFAS